MQTYFITFGVQYRREAHPRLPREVADPDGWLEITAPDAEAAYALAYAVTGGVFAALYHEPPTAGGHHPRGCVGTVVCDWAITPAG